MAEDNPGAKRTDFAAGRRASVDAVVEFVGEGLLHHSDFDGVEDTGDGLFAALRAHGQQLVSVRRTERAAKDREAGARALGVSVEEFDAIQQQRSAASQETTPEQRAANLPSGRGATIPASATSTPAATAPVDQGASGIALIEQAAAEDIAKYLSTGVFPRKATPMTD